MEMGFVDYFLIVWDVICYLCEVGILIGLGWGFVVGLFVFYVFRIMDVDLICYNLLFEWFLNLECIMMFDIDLDFLDNCWDEVILYVVFKYGEVYVV